MDKSRQQFEELFSKEHPNKTDSLTDFLIKDTAWEFWKLSRESIEPEIKHHQLRELVNTARDTAIKYQGCQCLRSALTTAIRNSLISSGVKIK